MYRNRSLVSGVRALAVALFLLAGVLTVTAQTTDPVLKTASLRLWPEYDDPGLLVIFAGDFATTAGFPRDVTFPLPAGARNMQAAYPDAAGGLLVAQSEVGTNQLTFKQLEAPAFHIEYYVDRQPSGNQREISYLFQAPFAIEALQITLQQPARSTDFSVSPAAESTFVGNDGLTYSAFSRTNLAAGDRLEIVMRYVKTDSGVSSPQLAVTEAGAPATAAPPARARMIDWLPWLLIGVGATAIAALATYWALAQRRVRVPAGAAPFAARQAPARASRQPAAEAGAGFCTQCGRQLGLDDRYCAQCGASRRG